MRRRDAAGAPWAKPFNVVFCDDIRREVSGKDILIGAYSGDVFLSSVPVTIGIAMWIQIRAKGRGTIKSRLRVTDPAGNTAGEMAFDQSVGVGIADAEITETTSALALPPLAISVIKAGVVSVYWAIGDDEYTLIGEKPIRIGVADVHGSPVAQSPPVAPG